MKRNIEKMKFQAERIEKKGKKFLSVFDVNIKYGHEWVEKSAISVRRTKLLKCLLLLHSHS